VVGTAGTGTPPVDLSIGLVAHTPSAR